eukprot:216358-Chlamydomonas_euryale.AAC.3
MPTITPAGTGRRTESATPSRPCMPPGSSGAGSRPPRLEAPRAAGVREACVTFGGYIGAPSARLCGCYFWRICLEALGVRLRGCSFWRIYLEALGGRLRGCYSWRTRRGFR